VTLCTGAKRVISWGYAWAAAARNPATSLNATDNALGTDLIVERGLQTTFGMIGLFAVLLCPSTGQAVELGLTPSHVFALWTNLNSCLLTIAAQEEGGEALVEDLKDLEVRRFDDKAPSDVLLAVEMVRSRVDAVRSRADLAPIAVYHDQFQVVTPSNVFLNSGHILDGLADFAAREGDVASLVTSCYEPQLFTGKTPSNVFELVDLAMRRTDVILAH
jgi:hypothetical protein